jgi:hypothetical protein
MTFTVPTQASSTVTASTTSAHLAITTLSTPSRIYWYAIPTADATAATVSKALVLNPVAKTGVVFNNAAVTGSPNQTLTGLASGIAYKLYYVFVSDADKTSSQLYSLDLTTLNPAVTLVAPAAGGTPATTATAPNGFTVSSVTWSPTDSPFVAGKVYIATITLAASANYSLTGVVENSFTITGATVSNSANAGVLTATFTALSIPAESFAIAGVTVPADDGTPVTTVTATDQYTGTVAWSTSNVAHTGPFEASTVYTATITLTPKAGFSLAGSFGVGKTYTVAGSTSFNQPTALTGTTLVFTVPFPTTA